VLARVLVLPQGRGAAADGWTLPGVFGRLQRVKGILVPGLCCRAEIWEAACRFLPGVDVLALDWPWPERIGSYDDGAAWLAEKIRAHAPDFVVGHSFGGVLALHLCGRMRQPPPWSLVIVESFLVTPHPFFRNHVWLPAPELRQRVATMLAEERPRFPILGEVASAEDPPQWRHRALASPATYIYGGRSGEHSPSSLGELAGVPASGGHDVHAVPGASHFPMLERPEQFYATLRDVLKIDGSPR
jgi:pimeloyl-ACP methyl ester carboxylesterase